MKKKTIELRDDREFHTTVSIGISSLDAQKDIDIESIIHRADNALYKVKTNGKNKVLSSID